MAPTEPLILKQQGSFFVGGRQTRSDTRRGPAVMRLAANLMNQIGYPGLVLDRDEHEAIGGFRMPADQHDAGHLKPPADRQ